MRSRAFTVHPTVPHVIQSMQLHEFWDGDMGNPKRILAPASQAGNSKGAGLVNYEIHNKRTAVDLQARKSTVVSHNRDNRTCHFEKSMKTKKTD